MSTLFSDCLKNLKKSPRITFLDHSNKKKEQRHKFLHLSCKVGKAVYGHFGHIPKNVEMLRIYNVQ